MKSRIHLSDSFTYSRLLQFTLPSIAMNIFSSLYIIVDGYFVATFAGKTEFAAVFAELMAAVVGSIFMVALRKRYHY